MRQLARPHVFALTVLDNEPKSAAVPQETLAVNLVAETWKMFQLRAQHAYFAAALRITRGNKEEAAKLSGVSHTTIHDVLRKLKDDLTG